MPTDILPSKKQQLNELEQIIEGRLSDFIEVGRALMAIRDSNLFNLDGFSTFKEYCQNRWQLDISTANRKIIACQTREHLAPFGAKHCLPLHEAVIRPLTRLLSTPNDITLVWNEAVERAPISDAGQPIITAKHVEAVVKAHLNPRDGEGITTFTGTYRVIYADPPWSYSDKQDIASLGGATKHYSLMTINELCEMTDDKGRHVKDIASKDAVLFLWVTSPLLAECFDVVEAWGFTYKASFVWDKVKHNMGHYNSVRHELLLICLKGSCPPDSKNLIDSVVSIERTKKHSEKPNEFREIIDSMYVRPEKLPKKYNDRIELFARSKHNGWDAFGDDIDVNA